MNSIEKAVDLVIVTGVVVAVMLCIANDEVSGVWWPLITGSYIVEKYWD